MTEWWHWLLFVLGNIPVVFAIGWTIFDSWAGFWESVKFVIMPDLISLFRGELIDDWWNELKFVWFLLSCVIILGAEYFLLVRFVL